MFELMWEFKFSPPGRGLWMMGTKYVYERGSAALNNCGYISTENIGVNFPEALTYSGPPTAHTPVAIVVSH